MATAYFTGRQLTDADVDGLIDGGAVPPVTGVGGQARPAPTRSSSASCTTCAKDAPNFQLSWDQALSPAQADALLTNIDKLFLLQITPGAVRDAMNATIGK